MRRIDEDPVGNVPSSDISKKKLDRLLLEGDAEAAALVLGSIEKFAQECTTVIRRFLRLEAWRGTQRIILGGGLRASPIGEFAIGRTAGLLKAAGHDIELQPICYDPDEAGLIECIHLEGRWDYMSLETRVPVGLMSAWSFDLGETDRIVVRFLPFAVSRN